MFRASFAVVLAASILCAAAASPVPGTSIWNFTAKSGNVLKPFVVGEATTVFSTGEAIRGLQTSDGKVLWTNYGEYGPVVASISGAVVYGATPTSITAFATASGTKSWTNTDVTPDTTKAPAATRSVVAVVTVAGTIVGVHANNGSTAWTNADVNCTNSLARIAGEGDSVIAACQTGFFRISAITGKFVWKHSAAAIYDPLFIGSNIYVLIESANSPYLTGYVACYDFSTGSNLWSQVPSGYLFASPTRGPPGMDVTVAFFTMEGRNLVSTSVTFYSINGQPEDTVSVDLSSGAVFVRNATILIAGDYQGLGAQYLNNTYDTYFYTTTPGYVDHPPVLVPKADALVYADNSGFIGCVAY